MIDAIGKFRPKLALKLAASFGMDCVGEAGPAPREMARGGDRARKEARSRKCLDLPRQAAKADRHAADLAPDHFTARPR